MALARQPTLEERAQALGIDPSGIDDEILLNVFRNGIKYGMKQVDLAANGWSHYANASNQVPFEGLVREIRRQFQADDPLLGQIQFLRVKHAYDHFGLPLPDSYAIYSNAPNNIGAPGAILEEAQKYQALDDKQRQKFLLGVHRQVTQRSGPYWDKIEQEATLIGPIMRYFADHLREYDYGTQGDEVDAIIDARFPSLYHLAHNPEAVDMLRQVSVNAGKPLLDVRGFPLKLLQQPPKKNDCRRNVYTPIPPPTDKGTCPN